MTEPGARPIVRIQKTTKQRYIQTMYTLNYDLQFQ